MRVKKGFKGRRRHKKFLKMAKGMRGARSKLYRTAREQVQRGLKIAYKERRRKKRAFRALWIVRINAAARALGTKYSELVASLSKTGITLDRKVLAEMAVRDLEGFRAVVNAARGA
ncbi:MAG: 50S ribosomal protein L20 [Deltaproteobacteria bacterium]|nr:50S ribosomal protein L20 [Deltaproteobacteria bacterium]